MDGLFLPLGIRNCFHRSLIFILTEIAGPI